MTAAAVGGLRTGIGGGASNSVDVLVRAEPKPMADSRVVLAKERDALGQRRLELQYRRSPEIDASIQQTLEVFARELGLAGVGRMRIDLDDTDKTKFEIPTIGFHLMGTTRMASIRSRAWSTPTYACTASTTSTSRRAPCSRRSATRTRR